MASPHPATSLRGHLLTGIAILAVFGCLGIYSASALRAHETTGMPGFYLYKQLATLAAGFLLVVVAGHLPLRHLLPRLALPLTLLGLVLLALIAVPGLYQKAGGAYRWLDLGAFRFQTGELAKTALVFFVARQLSRPAFRIGRLRSLLPILAITGIYGGLLLLQPDFGTACLLAAIALGLLYIAGLARRYLWLAAGAGAALVIAAIWVAPYRLRRLTAFWDPWAQADGGGFQIIQSYLAFQNGGLWGVGLGHSRQKFHFLPEAHTDFILPVIGEEMGLFAVLTLCAVFFYLTVVGWRIARAQTENFGRYLALGLTLLIALQAVFNIGVAMGLLPTKGIALPLVSSGTSATGMFLIDAALLATLARPDTSAARRAP